MPPARSSREIALGAAARAAAGAAWSVVIPVKRLASAKSRLTPPPGVDRAGLALAMACDTVAAATACDEVGLVVVVTDDEQARAAVARAGAAVVPDRPDAGLNPALVHGATQAERVRPGCPVAALSADLPALRPAELAIALRAAAGARTAVVADAKGEGTTMYTAQAGQPFTPRFGTASLAAHVAAGAVMLQLPSLSTLRCDVDDADDLRAAASLGVGPRTAAALGRPHHLGGDRCG